MNEPEPLCVATTDELGRTRWRYRGVLTPLVPRQPVVGGIRDERIRIVELLPDGFRISCYGSW